MIKIPLTVIHYSGHDPQTTIGGVQTFARNLRSIFDDVQFMTPTNRDLQYALKQRIPVICDNQRVLDWPKRIPVIGFQHGVGAVKFDVTRSQRHRQLARAQKRAAKRQNTLWVACAEWIGTTFGQLYGNRAEHVVYHTVDVSRFDGKLENTGSRLILHDARTSHKGAALLKEVKMAFPEWRIEPLDCAPDQVPERMRRARAFIHLSLYEGNSIVCNEAMAMNLPCMFTTVGLMRDSNRPSEVYLVDPDEIYGIRKYLIEQVGAFLESLESKTYNPRAWILENAIPEVSLAKWIRVMTQFEQISD